MDSIEAEENLFAISDAKLHGAMCKQLSVIVYKVLGIFPVLEAARPRSKAGIQALCSFHVAIEKAKSLLQHCSECSKLYLAITADSILVKFEKAKCSLEESLQLVEGIVPEAIGCQIMEIIRELGMTVFTLDPSEKQVGDEVIALLQKEKRFDSNSNDAEELEVFHQAASKLGILSSRAALIERRALKRLIEKARGEEDKRKESIAAYLLHLMRKYSKLFRIEVPDDIDSQGSAPCSPTVIGSVAGDGGDRPDDQAFERQISKISSLNFMQNGVRLGNMPIPPEELRCPISLQLMYDPVIISSGQTYERIGIEKWFSDGHNTCPKTRQQLPHLCLTPNYSVKGLIASWCEQNGVPVPDGPPESLDLNYWRLALSQHEATYSRSLGTSGSCQMKDVQVVAMGDSGSVEKPKANLGVSVDSGSHEDDDLDESKYENLLAVLSEGGTVEKQCIAVEQIRFLLKDDEEARIFMGANGFVEALLQFLRSAVHERDGKAQETGAMALFNLAVNNNRNKEMLLFAGAIPLLEEMIQNSDVHEAAAALYLNLSCLDKAKPIIGSSQAVPFLIQLLQASCYRKSCKLDALYALYNLSTDPENISSLIAAGTVNCLHSILAPPTGSTGNLWAEKTLAVLKNLASSTVGKKEIVSTSALIGTIAWILDNGAPAEQEQAASCTLALCDDEKYINMVLQEGVIPAVVCISANGTPRGKEKAQKLLKLFREQRQRELTAVQEPPQQVYQIAVDGGAGGGLDGVGMNEPEDRPLSKSRSKRLGRALTSMWKLGYSSRYRS